MAIFDGFIYLFSDPAAIAWVALAAFLGTLVGALPGLTAAAAIAMLLPLTFYLEPLPALAFLYVMGKSGRFGGSIAAIIFNTPGTAAAAATMLDGHPMARQGNAGKALKTATLASVFGDTFGEMVLIFGAVYIAMVTIKFGPPEYFAIYAMAFVVVGSVIGSSVTRGLASCLFGILISLVGLDPISGAERMTFGIFELSNGFGLVPVLIGLFVFTEVFDRLGQTKTLSDASAAITDFAGGLSWAEVKRCIPVALRSSVLGSLIGLLPGLGSSVACFVAYGEEKRRSKTPEKWGTGIVEGIAAPESANNAVSGPSMVPLLTLGIPGSTIAAILVGVFTIHGIQVGPSIFTVNRDLIFGLFAAGLLGIAMYGLLGYFAAPLFARALQKIRPELTYPLIFLIGFMSAYAARSNLFDIGVALAFGVIGVAMRRAGFSAPAFVISFVLAKGAEEAFRQSLLLSDQGAMIFLTRPIALGFLLLGLAVVILRGLGKRRRKLVPDTVDKGDDA
jgi:putative tricarboxylic transport membrane protein